jgi:hypothetical protein
MHRNDKKCQNGQKYGKNSEKRFSLKPLQLKRKIGTATTSTTTTTTTS